METNIKIAANCVIALDGIHPVSLKKGEVRLVPDHVAESLLSDGRATKADAVTHETKSDDGDGKKSGKKGSKKKG